MSGDSSNIQVEFGALSHVGKVRTNNEDHFLICRLDRSIKSVLTNIPQSAIPAEQTDTAFGMVVADGMGGPAAGEVASREAILALWELVRDTPDWIMRLDKDMACVVQFRLKRRFEKVREILLDKVKENKTLAGMGTTLTVAASLGNELFIGHLGDTRAYLFSHDHLYRLTQDQTVAQALADAGALPIEKINAHPMRHMLTGVISTEFESEELPQLHRLRVRDGDQLLLCSDGLTELVSDSTVEEILRLGESPALSCQKLVQLALQNGGHDNITTLVARYRIR